MWSYPRVAASRSFYYSNCLLWWLSIVNDRVLSAGSGHYHTREEGLVSIDGPSYSINVLGLVLDIIRVVGYI